jgi:copper chaperone
MAQQQFSVDGLHCDGNARTVTDALMNLSAVKSVDVELDTKDTSTVRIDADPPLSSAEVQAAMDSRGNFSVLG